MEFFNNGLIGDLVETYFLLEAFIKTEIGRLAALTFRLLASAGRDQKSCSQENDRDVLAFRCYRFHDCLLKKVFADCIIEFLPFSLDIEHVFEDDGFVFQVGLQKVQECKHIDVSFSEVFDIAGK